MCCLRGRSSVGRATRSQCVGQGFESPRLQSGRLRDGRPRATLPQIMCHSRFWVDAAGGIGYSCFLVMGGAPGCALVGERPSGTSLAANAADGSTGKQARLASARAEGLRWRRECRGARDGPSAAAAGITSFNPLSVFLHAPLADRFDRSARGVFTRSVAVGGIEKERCTAAAFARLVSGREVDRGRSRLLSRVGDGK